MADSLTTTQEGTRLVQVEQESVLVSESTVSQVIQTEQETVLVSETQPAPDRVDTERRQFLQIHAAGEQGPQGPPGPTGPEGPQGPKGEKGDAAGRHLHRQNEAASVWTITHNLGYRPHVQVIDSAEEEVYGDVRHLDPNTTEITFTAPFGGEAVLS